MKSTKQLTTRELLERVRDALAANLTRQQMAEFDELARVRPDIIDYYAGLAGATDTVRKQAAAES